MSHARVKSLMIRNHHTLPDHTIDLRGHQHLIVTGPNGAGKTTVLAQLAETVFASITGKFRDLDTMLQQRTPFEKAMEQPGISEGQLSNYERTLEALDAEMRKLRVDVVWSEPPVDAAMVVAYLAADRRTGIKRPKGPSELPAFSSSARAGRAFVNEFLQLLVNRHTTLHMSLVDQPERAAALRAGLASLTSAFRVLFAEPSLEFVYDREKFQVDLSVSGRTLRWETMAAGHHAILEIVADVFTRCQMVEDGVDAYGFVMIDEPELHLHPELQERILPGLTGLFPNLQFLVASHSAMVLCSVDDAWVHDLRHQTGISSKSLVGRPYGAVLQSHFEVSDYDIETTERVVACLEQAEVANTTEQKQRALEALSTFLDTEDPRILHWWTRLSVELAA